MRRTEGEKDGVSKRADLPPRSFAVLYKDGTAERRNGNLDTASIALSENAIGITTMSFARGEMEETQMKIYGARLVSIDGLRLW